MSKKILVLLLAFSLLYPLSLSAKEKRGADLLIEKLNGLQVRGELIAVKQNSLLLQARESGADVTVDIEDVRAINIVRKSKALFGAGLGLVIGASSGALIGHSIGDAKQSDSGWFDLDFFWDSAEFKALLCGVLAGILGAVIGGTVGANAGRNETIQIKGKTDLELKTILEKLRKIARIKNYQ
jgi:hypothetical protein